MTTTTTTRTIKTPATEIKITLERGTWEETISLDGMECGSKIHSIDRISISAFVNGQRLDSNGLKDMPANHPQGATGYLGGNWWVSAATEAMIRSAIAELEAENPKTPDQIAIETAAKTADEQHDAWYNAPEEIAARKFAARMDDPDSDL
jgi:hypothetical protein